MVDICTPICTMLQTITVNQRDEQICSMSIYTEKKCESPDTSPGKHSVSKGITTIPVGITQAVYVYPLILGKKVYHSVR